MTAGSWQQVEEGFGTPDSEIEIQWELQVPNASPPDMLSIRQQLSVPA
jgi:hypothetical protein